MTIAKQLPIARCSIVKALMRRDRISKSTAVMFADNARAKVKQGKDPVKVLKKLDLDLDYFFDLYTFH